MDSGESERPATDCMKQLLRVGLRLLSGGSKLFFVAGVMQLSCEALYADPEKELTFLMNVQ